MLLLLFIWDRNCGLLPSEGCHIYLVLPVVTLGSTSLFDADVLRVLEDGDLQTIGLLDYDKRLTHSFTAHPKVDPFTGEIILSLP